MTARRSSTDEPLFRRSTARSARALGLTALLLLSALAVPGLFAAPAAAAQAGSITAEPSTAGSTAVHNVSVVVDSNEGGSSLSKVQVDYHAGSGDTDASNVDNNSVLKAYLIDGTDGSRTGLMNKLGQVDVSNNGETLKINFGGSVSIQQNDTVYVVYEDVQNPGDSGTFDVALDINPQSSGAAVTEKLKIEPNPGNLNVTADPNVDDAYADHRVSLEAGTGLNNTTLNNLTVDYTAGNFEIFPDYEYEVEAFVDTNGNRTYDDSSDRLLNVTGITNDGTSLTVSFDGNYTFDAGSNEQVVLAYDLDNAVTPDTYTIEAYANNNTNATLTDSLTIRDSRRETTYVSPYPDAVDANSTHQVRLYDQRQAVIGDSLNSIQVDYAVGSNASDVSNVDQNDIERIGIDRTGGYGIDVNVSDDVSSVDASNNGETLRIELGGSYDIQEGDDIIVEYSDVQNPSGSTDIESDVAVGLNTQSDPYEPAFDRVYYDRDDFDGYLRAVDHADSATNATYNLYAEPGTADGDDTLDNITVDMNASVGWEETAFDGDLSAITAGDVTAETGQKSLNVTSVDASTESATFTFSGDYALTAGELVQVQFHGVTNPDRPGYHYANVTLNSDTQNTSLSYYRIELSSSVTDASVTPADDSPGATTTHNITATVDPLDDSDGLETMTAIYLNESANLSGATVDSVAIRHDGGPTETLSEEDYHGHVHGGYYGGGDDDDDSGSSSSDSDTTTTTAPESTQEGSDSDSEGDTERGSADETTSSEPASTTTEQPTTETTTSASTTSTSTPGLTVLTALAALAGAVLLFRRD